jgi:hypothetical protein
VSVAFSIVSGVLLVALIIFAVIARQPLLIVTAAIVLGLFAYSLLAMRRHRRSRSGTG